jgi:hypothetical protein
MLFMAMAIRKLTPVILFCLFIQSCTRKDIQFGDDPENNYTNIVFTDTISVQLSTVITDSFETNGATSFLLGKYKDPYLGTVSAKNFFQMTVSTTTPDIPASARYDSISFIFHPNDYYYGDTSLLQTFYVNELSQTIAYSYNNRLYSTSSVPVKPTPLGSKTIRIRPVADDSIEIRLNDTKGLELFSKLQQLSTDVTNADEFLNYFKGVSLTTDDNDTTTVYGLQGAAGRMVMRVYYHTTIPYAEKKWIDFTSLANDLAFNQVLTDRSGTGIVSGGSGLTEISALQTNDHSFLQPGTGVYLKIIFPSLKSIITTDREVKLLKAELIIRPAYLSFDKNKYKLPSPLYLTQTDESNISNAEVLDTTGSAVQYASPVTDDLYGENNYYRFDVTPYISQMLTSAGSEDHGFYVMHNISDTSINVSRLIANNALHGGHSSKLLLSVIIINK